LTRDQALTLVILVAVVGLFIWDRLRYDVVALLGLLAAVAAGVLPANRAFSGFSNPVLPLIAAALIVSAAIGQSGAVDILVRWLGPLLRSRELQVGVLVACVTALSAFMKNIGALAIFMPAAIQVARRAGRSPSEFLMPLAFASLIGGSMTLVGTSPNMLASAVRQQLTGQPFHMFDFTPVGAGIAICGVLFLAVGWRLIPRGLRGSAADTAFTIEDYTSELRVAEGSPFAGRTVRDLEEVAGGEVAITGIIREEYRRYVPSGSWILYANDVLVVEADPAAIEQLAREGNLELVGSEEAPAAEQESSAAATDSDAEEEAKRGAARRAAGERDIGVIEAVVTPGSDLVGRSAAELHLRERHGLNVLAIGRRGRSSSARLRRVKFQLGDAIVFQGYTDKLATTLAELGCLPLAERQLQLGRPRQLLFPLIILATAIIVTGFELVPVEIAFVAAALALLLIGVVSLKEAYASIEWPILVLLGALIPLGEAVQHTGTAELIAGWVFGLAEHIPAYAVLGAVMVITMLVTPILHHAAAVLVMGPIAASLAQKLGYSIDPFLMAVAFGAGSDFLSPIGHQSNTLVMGPGGYRFGDYWHLGLPLSLLVIGLGVPLILIFWPLH
jgi:di/tricarboxylate transporter